MNDVKWDRWMGATVVIATVLGLLWSVGASSQTLTPGIYNGAGQLTVETLGVDSYLYHDRTGFKVSDPKSFAGYDYVKGENDLKSVSEPETYFTLTLASSKTVYLLLADAPERQWILDLGFSLDGTSAGISNSTAAYDRVYVATLAAGDHQFLGLDTGTNNHVVMWAGLPQPCPWDAGILDDNPLCVECQWVPGILESDPACVQPYTEDALLNWTPPTENVCGPPVGVEGDPDYCPPLDDLAGYKVYYGVNDGGPYPMFNQVADPVETSHVVQALPEGTWHFVATAYDMYGNESVYSNQADKIIMAQVQQCPWDNTIMDDDPLCIECSYVPGILESDPLCVPPTTTLQAVNGQAFKLQAVPDGFVFVYVGTVPVGTDCDPNEEVKGYFIVPAAAVAWVGTVEPIAVVAQCE